MINTRSGKYLEEINRFGSISQAAKYLYISQPYLSKFIKELETDLGTELLNREKNPITLTYAGERYIEYMNQIKYTYDEMKSELQMISGLKKGRLVIGINPILAAHALYKILPEFIKEYPGIELKLIEESAHRIEQLLIDNKIDIAITILPFYQGVFQFETLSKEPIYLMIPSNHSLITNDNYKNKSIFEIHQELVNDNFILLKPNMALRKITNQILEDNELEPNIAMETISIDNALRLVNEGLGITYVPESVKNSSKHFEGLSIKLENPSYFNQVVVAYKSDKFNHLSKAAHMFIELAKATYNKNEDE